jgi:S1-C subfamily serine protease
VGLAIPVNKVKRVVPELIGTGRFPHPFLGIEGLGYVVSAELAEALRLPVQEGVLIARIYSGSPADRAGVRGATQEAIYGRRRLLIGGDVLVEVDGLAVRTWEDLDAYIQEQTEIGQEVTLTLWRGGERLDLPVTVGEEPQ